MRLRTRRAGLLAALLVTGCLGGGEGASDVGPRDAAGPRNADAAESADAARPHLDAEVRRWFDAGSQDFAMANARPDFAMADARAGDARAEDALSDARLVDAAAIPDARAATPDTGAPPPETDARAAGPDARTGVPDAHVPEADAASPDLDDDGVPEASDNCPALANRDQADADLDGVGDLCDDCRLTADPEQTDTDGDTLGDACDVCPEVAVQAADHLDADGDGVPVCAGDCDDAEPRAAPGFNERCDGLDNDCDGEADELFPELGRPCGAGVGECARVGERICAAGGASDLCDALAGVPADEVCDGLDNDCDGTVDEGIADCCAPGATQVCGQAVGVCTPGVSICDAARRWGPCDGSAPADEVCNGLDDDCDGETDEGLGQLTCGEGRCHHDVPACDAEAPAACDPLAGAEPERCNGVDDDCDGQIDDGLPARVCGVGLCSHPVAACVGGLPGACHPADPLPAEVCDGLDNDCNGVVDDARGVPATVTIIQPSTPGLAPPVVAAGARALIAWRDDVNHTLWTAMADADGQILVPPAALADPGVVEGPVVTRAPDGGFAAFYGVQGSERRMVLVSENGVYGDPIRLTAPGVRFASGLSAAFTGTEFLVTWIERDRGETAVLATVDSHGRPLGDPYLWNPAGAGAVFSTVAVASNGFGYALAWEQSVQGHAHMVFRFFNVAHGPESDVGGFIGVASGAPVVIVPSVPGGPYGFYNFQNGPAGLTVAQFGYLTPGGLGGVLGAPFLPFFTSTGWGAAWMGNEMLLAANSGPETGGPAGTLFRRVDFQGASVGNLDLGPVSLGVPGALAAIGTRAVVAASRVEGGAREIQLIVGRPRCP